MAPPTTTTGGGLKIGKALRSAALLPVKGIRAATPNRRSSNNPFAPAPGEEPLVILRLQVVACMQLLAKDRGGTSDPFVVASVLNTRHQTPVAKKTLNPTYAPKDATFDFPLYLSTADKLGVLELVVWDKDLVGKDYLGEVAVPLDEWFDLGGGGGGRVCAWADEGNKPFSLNLLSTRDKTVATGSVQIKLGFVHPPNAARQVVLEDVYRDLVKRSRPSLVSAPPTQGVGTVSATSGFEDDGGLSSSDEASDDEDDSSSTHSSSQSSSESDTDDADSNYEDAEDDEEEERAVKKLEEVEVVLDGSGVAGVGGVAGVSAGVVAPGVLSNATSTSTVIPPSSPPPAYSATPPATTGTPATIALNTTTTATAEGAKKGRNEKDLTVEVRSPATPTQGSVVDTPVPLPVTATPASVAATAGTPAATTGTTTAAAATMGATGTGATPAAPTPKTGGFLGMKAKLPAFGRKKSTASAGGVGTPSSTSSSTSSVPTLGSLGLSSSGGESGSGVGTPSRSGTSSPALGSGVETPSATSASETGGEETKTKAKKGKKKSKSKTRRTQEGGSRKKKKKQEYKLDHDNDIVGIVMLEIKCAEDLPKLANMTRTGWDMDPFVVISFGKKVFRTRVIRHSRNPVWDEKLLFHVRRYETAFKVGFQVLDWDKLSANDHIGDASFDIKDLILDAPQADPTTGLYPLPAGKDGKEEEEHPLKDITLKLETPKGGGGVVSWEGRHSPTLSVRAKYQPYAALRQRFWRQYLKEYDTDDTATLSRVELTSMLDSLGSTLTSGTVDGFFTRFNKDPQTGELTIGEAIQALETELCRPESEKKRLDLSASADSALSTPVVLARGVDAQGREMGELELDFSGRPRVERDVLGGTEGTLKAPEPVKTSGNQQPLAEVVAEAEAELEAEDTVGGSQTVTKEGEKEKKEKERKKKKKLRFGRKKSSASANPAFSPTPSSSLSSSGSPSTSPDPSGLLSPALSSTSPDPSSSSPSSSTIERVINVKNCPMCHRPRLNSKAELDIITHMAICASQDWGAVDKIMVGNFVTASQAQRKWYTKVLGKVGAGDYKLGANSANIIVQNRMTGQLEEEKMQVYVRLGIRLLYKGATSQMEGSRARRLLKSMSIKQGVKYDDPASAREIPSFIEFHNLDVNEVLDPLDSFKTFNEFFYRKLKPDARPIDAPSDPYRLISAADCRFMAFETVSSATKIWIKGRDFSVERLLGDKYKGEAGRYEGGALAIFRLAPQDYHRFHSPVDGVVGEMVVVSGEYYTVNPQAIRSSLDVYGENVRKIVPIDSPQFGRVMAVCVGAMMVGSIHTTVEEGQKIKKGDEFGYFAFGGSTIVILFEKGAVEWDEDLLINSKASLETLVRVGMGIGRGDPARFPGGSA